MCIHTYIYVYIYIYNICRYCIIYKTNSKNTHSDTLVPRRTSVEKSRTFKSIPSPLVPFTPSQCCYLIWRPWGEMRERHEILPSHYQWRLITYICTHRMHTFIYALYLKIHTYQWQLGAICVCLVAISSD